MKTIGIGYQNYSSKRNIDYPENKNILYNTYDTNLLIAYISKLLPFLNGKDLKNIFRPKYSFSKQPQLYHLFNSIIIEPEIPWLTTFETIVPRHALLLNEHKENFPNYSKYKNHPYIKKMLPAFRNNCLGLIAMSECAKQIQLDFFSQMNIPFDTRKLVTILPPQSLLYDDPRDINCKKLINFTFVGNDFFRKGGYEILLAFSELKQKCNFPIKLTIVFNIRDEWYGNSNKAKLSEVKALISNNSSWITYLRKITNKEVINLLKNTDVGLLPTWSDSFGYSILEMQASGVPVITTDVRAIPEINNSECGWIIKMNKNIYGELLDYRSKQNEISASIQDQLKSIINEIMLDKSIIIRKSIQSLYRIAQFHDPKEHSKKLEYIYTNC